MQNLRLDFTVETAGCLIWVAPRSLGGLTPTELGQVWMGQGSQTTEDLVARGAMMPMSLYQDDGYHVRFILGNLSEQEQAEWTARASWKLGVPCGEVLVSGVLTPDFEYEFAQMPEAENGGSYWLGGYVKVPPGEYQIEVYSYPPGDLSSGWGQITNPELFGKHQALEPETELDYFRRTRPGQQPPAWIAEPYDETSYINFVILLSPLSGEIELPSLEGDGCVEWEFRKPQLCPLGIRPNFPERD